MSWARVEGGVTRAGTAAPADGGVMRGCVGAADGSAGRVSTNGGTAPDWLPADDAGTTGCGPRDGTRENGPGACPAPGGTAASGGRDTGLDIGWVSGAGPGWIDVSSPASNDRAKSSRVTPAGSVSSIGRRPGRLAAGSGRGGTPARCSAETGTVGACPTVAAKFGATRIRVAWLVSSAGSDRLATGGAYAAGRGIMTV